jgi:hypothetical protein
MTSVIGSNPNDSIRQQILGFFYNRNAHATSRFGKKGSAVKISDVKAELKALHGLTQQQVMSNLTYLIDRGWVKTIDQEKTVTTRGGTAIPSVVTFYEITAQGIERVEGPSQFEPPDRYAGININATGSNVITLGRGNYVNANFQQLSKSLSEFKEAVTQCDELSDETKLEVAVDIETIKDQLVKTRPDTDVVARLWSRIEQMSAVAGLAGFVTQIAPLIGHLVGV